MSKVILITGTRKGIGRYVAEYYSQKDYNVIGCSREPIDFDLTNYEHFSCDITQEKEVKLMLTDVWKKHRRLDILINNAGVNLTLLPVLLVPYEKARKTVEINLLGTFLVCRESAKLMMKHRFGRIINFSSMAVKHEVKGEAIYTASKSAIISFTRILAKEVFSYGITCNVIAPSAIKTDLMNAVDQSELQKILESNAINELGEMTDVSNTIDWLIRPESEAVTSQVIYLGGV